MCGVVERGAFAANSPADLFTRSQSELLKVCWYHPALPPGHPQHHALGGRAGERAGTALPSHAELI